MLCVVMLNVTFFIVMLCVVVLSHFHGVMLCVVMLSVTVSSFYDVCCYAECLIFLLLC